MPIEALADVLRHSPQARRKLGRRMKMPDAIVKIDGEKKRAELQALAREPMQTPGLAILEQIREWGFMDEADYQRIRGFME